MFATAEPISEVLLGGEVPASEFQQQELLHFPNAG
jgi:hypothetical protein